VAKQSQPKIVCLHLAVRHTILTELLTTKDSNFVLDQIVGSSESSFGAAHGETSPEDRVLDLENFQLAVAYFQF